MGAQARRSSGGYNLMANQGAAARQFDGHVGQKLRAARKAAGLSQSALGERVDVTFQQIQKYEKGVVRISAGRLAQFAKVLNVPIQFFFEEILQDADSPPAGSTNILDLTQVSEIKSACIKLIAIADDDDVKPLFDVLERFISPAVENSFRQASNDR